MARPAYVVLGTVDDRWRIASISSDVRQLLSVPPERMLGTSAFAAVHREDVTTLLSLAMRASDRAGDASGRVRVRTGDGEWLSCRVCLHVLVGEDASVLAFSLCAVGDIESQRDLRSQELEEHLRRIAREIAASGVAAMSMAVPTSLDVPEISTLTSREYEIVVRLARGERVPTIARALFLSESTVRNHLTSVFRKFGVKSQNELLARLHQSDASPP